MFASSTAAPASDGTARWRHGKSAAASCSCTSATTACSPLHGHGRARRRRRQAGTAATPLPTAALGGADTRRPLHRVPASHRRSQQQQQQQRLRGVPSPCEMDVARLATFTPYTFSRYSLISSFVHTGSVRNRKWLYGSFADTRRTSVSDISGKWTMPGAMAAAAQLPQQRQPGGSAERPHQRTSWRCASCRRQRSLRAIDGEALGAAGRCTAATPSRSCSAGAQLAWPDLDTAPRDHVPRSRDALPPWYRPHGYGVGAGAARRRDWRGQRNKEHWRH